VPKQATRRQAGHELDPKRSAAPPQVSLKASPEEGDHDEDPEMGCHRLELLVYYGACADCRSSKHIRLRTGSDRRGRLGTQPSRSWSAFRLREPVLRSTDGSTRSRNRGVPPAVRLLVLIR